jgi:hypothetical protein
MNKQRSLLVGNFCFKKNSNEYEIYQVFSLMVGEACIYVFYNCIPCPSNLKHCWFTIWNWMNFSLVGIFIDLRKCQRLDNLDKLIFVDKNWPNNCRIGCKPFFSLVELIEVDIKLKEELKKIWKNIWER